ncbi:hypothetical protein SRABI106_02526 [Rahnella aquatilis]|nr:hypothetical protein SRABI106_02526 [Rahnella aquatilis]
MHEISRTQNGGGDVMTFDHAFNRMLAGKVRNVGEFISMDHRQINDTLNARLAGEVQGDQGLSNLIGRNRIQQKQRSYR